MVYLVPSLVEATIVGGKRTDTLPVLLFREDLSSPPIYFTTFIPQAVLQGGGVRGTSTLGKGADYTFVYHVCGRRRVLYLDGDDVDRAPSTDANLRGPDATRYHWTIRSKEKTCRSEGDEPNQRWSNEEDLH